MMNVLGVYDGDFEVKYYREWQICLEHSTNSLISIIYMTYDAPSIHKNMKVGAREMMNVLGVYVISRLKEYYEIFSSPHLNRTRVK